MGSKRLPFQWVRSASAPVDLAMAIKWAAWRECPEDRSFKHYFAVSPARGRMPQPRTARRGTAERSLDRQIRMGYGRASGDDRERRHRDGPSGKAGGAEAYARFRIAATLGARHSGHGSQTDVSRLDYNRIVVLSRSASLP